MILSDYVIKSLRLLDDTIFFVPGGACLPLVNSIGKYMPFICTFGEQSAGWAATARARINGIGICLGSSGPAATNFITPISGSWQDSVPVLFITGQVSSKEYDKNSIGLRQQGWLGVDITNMARNITKYCAYVDDPKDIKFHLENAVSRMFSGRPGPALLDIPFDLQGVDVNLPLPSFSSFDQKSCDIREIVELLNSAKKPLILAGHGINIARESIAFRKLVNQINVPVVTTPLGIDIMEFNSPQFIGIAGVCGSRAGNYAVQNADVILSIGNSLHIRTTGYDISKFAPHAKIIQIDIDETNLHKTKIKAYKQIQASVSYLIESLLKEDFISKNDDWNKLCLLYKDRYSNNKEPHNRNSDRINQYDFIEVINEMTPDDTIYVTSAGACPHIIPQAIRIRGKQRLIAYSDGAMGFTIPGTLGVCSLDKYVIAIVGDGDFQINSQELQIIKHHRFNPKIFIINNNGYCSIRNSQKSIYGTIVGADDTGLSFPKIEDIAKLYDIKYTICNKKTMRDDIANTLSFTKEPVICEVFALTDQMVMPKAVGRMQADGTMKPSELDAMSPEIIQ